MSKNRIKLPPLPDDIGLVLLEIAALTATKLKLFAEMDERLIAMRARHQAGIDACDEDLETLTAQAERWAITHPDKFKPVKSLVFPHGTIGFRDGQPALKLLAKWTWNKSLETLQAANDLKWIRLTPAVNKERILADKPDPKLLAELGMKITQKLNEFYIEPNLTPVETRQNSTRQT